MVLQRVIFHSPNKFIGQVLLTDINAKKLMFQWQVKEDTNEQMIEPDSDKNNNIDKVM